MVHNFIVVVLPVFTQLTPSSNIRMMAGNSNHREKGMGFGYECPEVHLIALWSWLYVLVRVHARERSHNQHYGSEGIILGIIPQANVGRTGEVRNQKDRARDQRNKHEAVFVKYKYK